MEHPDSDGQSDEPRWVPPLDNDDAWSDDCEAVRKSTEQVALPKGQRTLCQLLRRPVAEEREPKRLGEAGQSSVVGEACVQQSVAVASAEAVAAWGSLSLSKADEWQLSSSSSSSSTSGSPSKSRASSTDAGCEPDAELMSVEPLPSPAAVGCKRRWPLLTPSYDESLKHPRNVEAKATAMAVEPQRGRGPQVGPLAEPHLHEMPPAPPAWHQAQGIWMEPVWAALQPHMMTLPAKAHRKLVVESLCSGTAAELVGIEVCRESAVEEGVTRVCSSVLHVFSVLCVCVCFHLQILSCLGRLGLESRCISLGRMLASDSLLSFIRSSALGALFFLSLQTTGQESKSSLLICARMRHIPVPCCLSFPLLASFLFY